MIQLFHHTMRQGADLPSERLVGHGDQLAQKQIAITGNAALALFEAKPKDSGVLYKPSSGWDYYRRWIPRFIDEI